MRIFLKFDTEMLAILNIAHGLAIILGMCVRIIGTYEMFRVGGFTNDDDALLSTRTTILLLQREVRLLGPARFDQELIFTNYWDKSTPWLDIF